MLRLSRKHYLFAPRANHSFVRSTILLARSILRYLPVATFPISNPRTSSIFLYIRGKRGILNTIHALEYLDESLRLLTCSFSSCHSRAGTMPCPVCRILPPKPMHLAFAQMPRLHSTATISFAQMPRLHSTAAIIYVRTSPQI